MLIRAVEPLEGVDADARGPACSRRRAGAPAMTPDRDGRRSARWRGCPTHRLGERAGLVAAAFGLDTAWTGHRPVRPVVAAPARAAPADRAAAGRSWRRARIGDRLRRRAVGSAAVAVRRSPATRRSPAARAGALTAPTADDGRAIARPCSSSRSSARGWPRPPRSRRRGASPRRSSRRADPVIVARGARRDRPGARARSRSGPGVGDRRRARHRPAIERAARGGRLEPGAVPRDRRRRSTRPRGWPTSLADERRPLLRELGRELHALPALRSTLARSFDPVGELLDTASPRLGGLRAAVRVAYDRLRRRLDALVGAELGSALQEPIVTLRNGRYVVPVKAEARSRVKGIVHDASGSGQTLFIEPLVAVELGNAWREAQVAEAEEIARILDELSALVAANAARCARRSTRSRGSTSGRPRRRSRPRWTPSAPRPPTGPRSILLSARHPGLTGRVVPIDIRLGDGYTALVVTGPNTGGKTVTLRTLGLLSLMHQAGLHVPAAPGSRLPVLRDVFADIGDEQSIAQSLSTFSGHLRSIIRIVEAGRTGHARAARRARRRHRPDRGLGARPGAARPLHPGRRARRRDDPLRRAQGVRPHDAGRPERLGRVRPRDAVARPTGCTIGLPGGSQAFAIAERLGPAAADRRRRAVAPDRVAAHVRGDARRRSARPRARRARRSSVPGRPNARAADALHAAEEERRRARRERDEAVRAARAEAERVVERPSQRGRRRLAQALERETLTAPALDDAVARARATARPAARRLEPVAAAEPRRRRTEWRLGDRARSRSGGWEGRIAALERGGKRATLEAGGMRVTVDAADLVPGLRWHWHVRGAAVRKRRRGTRTGVGDIERLGHPRSSGPGPWRLRSTFGAHGSTRRSTRWLATSTTRRSRASTRWSSSTDSAPAPCATPCGRPPPDHPLVRSVRAGQRGEGGDGATIVEL